MTESIRQQSSVWHSLSPLQKQCLELIYQVDQEVKMLDKSRWPEDNYTHLEPFNWLLYGDIGTYQPSRLKLLILRAGLVNDQTEQTFHQLATHDLIECLGELPYLGIRLTWQGQTAIGDSAHSIAEDSTAAPKTERQYGKQDLPDALNESGWRSLSLAVHHHHNGDSEDLPISSDNYCAGIHLNVWTQLSRREPPLVSTRHSLVHVTAFGHVFYAENYDHHHMRYPAVNAPPPDYSREDIEQALWQSGDLPTLARLKRGKKGLGETAARIGSGITPALLYQFERRNVFDQQKIAAIQSWLER